MMSRKTTLFIAGAVASAALALSAPAASAAPSSAPDAAPVSAKSAPAYKHIKILKDGINIRAKATTKSASLGLAYKSHKVNFLASVRGETVNGEFNWVKVKDTTTGVTGYINAAYVELIP